MSRKKRGKIWLAASRKKRQGRSNRTISRLKTGNSRPHAHHDMVKELTPVFVSDDERIAAGFKKTDVGLKHKGRNAGSMGVDSQA